MHGASWWTHDLPLTNPRWQTLLNFAKCKYFSTRWRYLQPIWYKDATWTDYRLQLHWRQLSAYNIVDSVATNSTIIRCMSLLFGTDRFCCNCLLAHLSVEVDTVLWLPVCACVLPRLSVEVETVLWLLVCACVSVYHERLDVDQTW